MTAPVHADRDIVYTARYYALPGSHRTSHFHLYRVNPDGTGKTQLTFGTAEDHDATWSPDGTKIAFTRESEDGRNALCLIRAKNASVQTLMPMGPVGTEETYGHRWSPDGRLLAVVHVVYQKDWSASVSLLDTQTGRVIRRFVGASDFFWSPDARRAYLITEAGDQLLDLKLGREVMVKNRVEHPVWIDPKTMVGLASDPKSGIYFLRMVGMDGQETHHLPLLFPAPYAGGGGDSDDPATALGSLYRRPVLVYGINEHNSTVGVDWAFFRLQLTPNTMRYLTQGQFLAWSPDGLRFCTAPGRDTTVYDRRRYPFAVPKGATPQERAEDEHRLVWSAPLYIRAAGGGPMRALTPRLSWVTGADWRKPPKAALKRSL